ncbi:ubiquitin-conjugating enzyme E2 Q1-like [Oscarella lobularis]|uniref:ubiquitin-conjugating enzyme E2 Q1-like n=1 Tax=Oscarella lobularis TaxID=121494 RepID=UPI003313AFF9
MSGAFHLSLSQAREWASTDSAPFRLVSSNESERRLDFSAESKSFFVVCPSTTNARWHVWSDDPSSLSQLAEIQEYTDHCNRTLLQVLNRTSELLFPKASGDRTRGDADDGIDEDDEDDEDDYYYDDCEPEEDASAKAQAQAKDDDDDDEVTADDFFTGDGSQGAVHRLIRDLKNLKKTAGKFGVEGEPKDDNLFIWRVKLTKFEKGSLLARDLDKYAAQYKREPVVEMEMKFPKDYPMSPPFVRVIRPRFKFLTGHVTIGGSVCMELLTRSGWRPTVDIESVLVQIHSEMISDTRAQLDFSHGDHPYDETAAKQAFERMVRRYGWNK